MSPASSPRRFSEKRLMSLAGGAVAPTRIEAILDAGDVLVVNDARTLPASLLLSREPGAPPTLEARVWQLPNARARDLEVLLFDGVDHHLVTEARTHVEMAEGPWFMRAHHGEWLEGRVRASELDPHPRRATLSLAESAVSALFRAGRPIQYAHIRGELELWDVQTLFAGSPWAVEAPSAAFLLGQGSLDALRQRGVEIAGLTHAAGISSTGSPELDRRLPLPERYRLPSATVERIVRAHAQARRVVALGTTVVRALEGNAAEHQRLVAGDHATDLVLSRHTPLRVVDAVLTGVHEVASSHFELLEAFASRAALELLAETSAREGWLGHEFGDGWFVEVDAARRRAARAA